MSDELKDETNLEDENIVDETESVNDESEQIENEEVEESGEFVVGFGDETEDDEVEDLEKAPAWVKKTREVNRQQAKRIKELESKLESLNEADKTETKLPAKPTLQSCEYDEDRFEKELESWHETKRKVEQEVEQKQKVAEKSQAEWNKKLEKYNADKAKLPVKDYADVEDLVRTELSIAQQAIIIKAANDPALFVLALGRNSKKLSELAAMKDPIDFAAAIGRLEAGMKTIRKPVTKPESTVKGSGPVSGTTDARLKKLEEEADRTGDRSKVIAYRRELRKKGE